MKQKQNGVKQKLKGNSLPEHKVIQGLAQTGATLYQAKYRTICFVARALDAIGMAGKIAVTGSIPTAIVPFRSKAKSRFHGQYLVLNDSRYCLVVGYLHNYRI